MNDEAKPENEEEEDALDDDGDEQVFDPQTHGVTVEMFREWRSPRWGTANPERMTNPVWLWLVRSRISAYISASGFGEPSPFEAGPGWSFRRFGKSTTLLPDGRQVLIGGEHEDYYDPDFFIYNDVVVRHPDGEIEIFGYPREVFPPTDSHSATLAGGKIILIGNLGHPDQRKPGATQVLQLDTESLAISPVSTSGTAPGWLSGHHARLSDDRTFIQVEGGCVMQDQGSVHNGDEWALHLEDGRWEKLTDRRWQTWRLMPQEGHRSALWKMRMAVESEQLASFLPFYKDSWKRLELESAPDEEALEQLYVPSLAHERLPGEPCRSSYRISVQGVIIRFVEQGGCVEMVVEGDVPEEVVSQIVDEARQKLSRLEGIPYSVQRIG